MFRLAIIMRLVTKRLSNETRRTLIRPTRSARSPAGTADAIPPAANVDMRDCVAREVTPATPCSVGNAWGTTSKANAEPVQAPA